MKIYDYKIKNRFLALIGLLFLLYAIFLMKDQGRIARVFVSLFFVLFLGLSTGNKKFISMQWLPHRK